MYGWLPAVILLVLQHSQGCIRVLLTAYHVWRHIAGVLVFVLVASSSRMVCRIDNIFTHCLPASIGRNLPFARCMAIACDRCTARLLQVAAEQLSWMLVHGVCVLALLQQQLAAGRVLDYYLTWVAASVFPASCNSTDWPCNAAIPRKVLLLCAVCAGVCRQLLLQLHAACAEQ